MLARAGAGVAASVHYEPAPVAQLTRGREPHQATDRLRRIHSLCGQAHEIAFWRAIEAAHPDLRAGASREAARDLVLLVEVVLAHAGRVALELAPAAGQPVPAAAFRVLRERADACSGAIGLAGARARLDPRPSALPALFARLRQAFCDLLQQAAATPPARTLGLLPDTLADLVVEGWRAPWHFAEREPLLAQGRLERESALREPPPSGGPERGSAATSRGLLDYDVALQGGRVDSCGSSTPTARLAAPGGALATALGQLSWSDDVAGLADFVVRALDPCVPWTIRLADGPHA